MKKQNGLPVRQAGLPASSRRWQAGQTLLEVLLAFSISILVLSAIVLGVTKSLSNTQYAKNQGLANSYAQEGIAVVRQIKDSGLNKLSSYTHNIKYCLEQNSIILKKLSEESSSAENCLPNVADIFSREVKFEHDSSDCSGKGSNGSRVTVKVLWSDSKCPTGANIYCHNVELISCLFDIDQKQAP